MKANEPLWQSREATGVLVRSSFVLMIEAFSLSPGSPFPLARLFFIRRRPPSSSTLFHTDSVATATNGLRHLPSAKQKGDDAGLTFPGLSRSPPCCPAGLPPCPPPCVPAACFMSPTRRTHLTHLLFEYPGCPRFYDRPTLDKEYPELKHYNKETGEACLRSAACATTVLKRQARAAPAVLTQLPLLVEPLPCTQGHSRRKHDWRHDLQRLGRHSPRQGPLLQPVSLAPWSRSSARIASCFFFAHSLRHRSLPSTAKAVAKRPRTRTATSCLVRAPATGLHMTAPCASTRANPPPLFHPRRPAGQARSLSPGPASGQKHHGEPGRARLPPLRCQTREAPLCRAPVTLFCRVLCWRQIWPALTRAPAVCRLSQNGYDRKQYAQDFVDFMTTPPLEDPYLSVWVRLAHATHGGKKRPGAVCPWHTLAAP